MIWRKISGRQIEMIGFSAGVEAVERVCEKADIYKATRQKPPLFLF